MHANTEASSVSILWSRSLRTPTPYSISPCWFPFADFSNLRCIPCVTREWRRSRVYSPTSFWGVFCRCSLQSFNGLILAIYLYFTYLLSMWIIFKKAGVFKHMIIIIFCFFCFYKTQGTYTWKLKKMLEWLCLHFVPIHNTRFCWYINILVQLNAKSILGLRVGLVWLF